MISTLTTGAYKLNGTEGYRTVDVLAHDIAICKSFFYDDKRAYNGLLHRLG